MTRDHRWVRESGIGSADRSIYEHEVLSMILHHSVTWDMLQPGNLAGLEVAARRMQLIEEAVSENPEKPSWDGARVYMGTDEGRGGSVMAPGLRSYVASELGKSAAIQKEKRKAREAKGKGRGGKNPAAPEQ